MSVRHNKRRLELVPFEANTTRSIPLPRERYISHIDLDFAASVIVTGGSGAGAVAEDAALKLLPNIEIVGNGFNTIFRMSAQDLYYKNMFEFGTRPCVLDPTDDAAATYPVLFSLRLDFRNNVGLVPVDTLLPATKFRTLELKCTWGNPLTALFDSDADTTDVAISSAFGLRPFIHMTTEPEPIFARIQDFIEKEVTADSAEFIIEFPTGDRTYQDFMFLTTDTATAVTIRENDIIEFIDLITDETFRHVDKLEWIEGQHANKIMYSLESLYDGTGLQYKPADGLLYLYMLEDGHIPSGINVFNNNSFRCKMDVDVGTGVTRVRIIHDSVVPVKNILI